MVAQHPPDLILLDIMMPGMDGYQVAGTLKANPATKNIPIIVITSLDDRNARMLGLTAGAEDFLSKPVDRAELCMRVRNLLRLKAYGDYHDKYSQMLEGEVGSRTADLVESERLYRSTFDAAPVGIVHVGLDGQWLRVNQRLCDLLGYSREELQSPAVQELMQCEDVAGEAESFRQMAAGTLDRHVVDEKRYRRRDGSFMWARVNMSVHRDAHGPVPALHLGHRGHHGTADARGAGPAGEQDGRDRAIGVGRRPRLQQSAHGHSRIRGAHDRRLRHREPAREGSRRDHQGGPACDGSHQATARVQPSTSAATACRSM